MIAVDTNLLVYAHLLGSTEARRAQKALRRVSADRQGWGVALPVLVEFWRIVTSPGLPGSAPAPDAAIFLDGVLAAGARIWYPLPGFWERLVELAIARSQTARHIFDLEIALLARDNGARELWTNDRKFPELPGLRVVHPW